MELASCFVRRGWRIEMSEKVNITKTQVMEGIAVCARMRIWTKPRYPCSDNSIRIANSFADSVRDLERLLTELLELKSCLKEEKEDGYRC